MKFKTSKLLGLGIVMVVVCSQARAAITDGAGTWTGAGASFNAKNQQIATYVVELTNTAIDDHTIQTKGTITFTDGTSQDFEQTMSGDDQGFSLASDAGKGGGYCFGEGLCESYVGTGSHGFAVTEVIDGADQMRILSTELDNGTVVEFSREKLTRKR